MTTTAICEIDHRKMTLAEALLLDDVGKRKYFDGVLLAHPRVTQTLDELQIHTSSQSGNSVVLLVGPTGVGKTTLIKALEEQSILSHRDEIERDPGFIPVAMMVAGASGERTFSWKMFYSSLGHAMNEPLMDRKLETRFERNKTTVCLPAGTSSVAGMRMAVEKVMAQRRTKLIIVDEAVPLLRQANGNKLENHMDAIKTMADMGATLVLVGSYDLHRLAILNDQVARRTGTIHFTRYMTGIPADEAQFRKAIQKLQACLPIQDLPDLTEYSGDLHVATLGCVGLLKTILSRTLEHTMKNKGKWSDEFLEKSLLSVDIYGAIRQETLLGEARIKGMVNGSASFKSLREEAAAVDAKIRGIA